MQENQRVIKLSVCLCSKLGPTVPPETRVISLGEQQRPDGAEVALVLEEERFQRVLRPVVHGEGQQLHRDGIDAQKVADEHDLKVKMEKLSGRRR